MLRPALVLPLPSSPRHQFPSQHPPTSSLLPSPPFPSLPLRHPMSLSPTTGMSRLSLEYNSPLAPAQSRVPPLRTGPSMLEGDYPSVTSDWEVDEGEDEEEATVVSSPAGFKYNISRLSPRTRQVVKSLFDQESSHDPPQISLEFCGLREENPEGDGYFYAFQMQEVVPCSVRIGARDSGRFSVPRCECPDARYRHVRPCKHLVWLFDKISKQALIDHDPNSELTLTEDGYPEELGDAFGQISQISLDVLADGLRCDTSEPDSDMVPTSSARVREAREMVAAVVGIHPSDIDSYGHNFVDSYDRNTLIRRGDLEATLFSLLLSSHSLAQWIRSELHPSDPAVDPSRVAQQRVFRIIQELDLYSAAQWDPAAADEYQRRGKRAEGPRNLAWATTQIQHCVRKIEKLVSRGSTPLSEWARWSAARSLVAILKAVVSHRELYAPLVGDRDTGFVFSALDMLVDQSQFVDELEDIMETVGVRGAPDSYVRKMRSLVERMRSHKPENFGTTAGSGLPRSETPPLNEPPPAVQSPRPSSSSSLQFLTMGAPTSAMAWGGRGRGGHGRGNGRGSKRSISRSSPGDNPTSSTKRARGI
ncbi:hypothetical protein VTI74DRAFT_11624 [Chaetomium olivicolor]